LLGIGAGGVYPLAATLSAETDAEIQQQSQKADLKLRNVVLTFSMQGVGFLAVPVVAVALLYATPESKLDFVWRALLGLGALPGIVLVMMQWQLYHKRNSSQETTTQSDNLNETNTSEDVEEEFEDEVSNGDIPAAPRGGVWAAVQQESNLCAKMIGTAGIWFFFDVLFYGNTLFEPVVMEAAFGKSNSEKSLEKTVTDSLLLALIALPGYIVAALVIGKRLCGISQTPRFVQSQGFLAMAVLYAVIGSLWTSLKTLPPLLVFVYGMTFFFANYGPNTTTFVLPSLLFSEECRSTLNGISAASGKAGALLGATLFAPAAESIGSDRVMRVCGGLSIMAFLMTLCFVHLPSEQSSRRIEAE